MAKRKISESNIRTILGMMRSIASHKPISPFHLHAADELEKVLEELLELRKKKWVGLTEEDFKKYKSDEFIVFAKAVEVDLKERNYGAK